MLKLLISALFLIILATPANSWHDAGHKITGYIAWQRMSPAARENVIRILRAAPEDSHLATSYHRYGPPSDAVRQLDFFMLIPTWADMARDPAFPVRARKYHKSNWHYDDNFWKQVDGKAEILSGFDEGGQAVAQLFASEKTMRDATAKDADKAIAMAWFAHLTGDLHQPLHTSARVTEFEPKGDQGGNLFLLTPKGTPRAKQVDLHWFWDSIVVQNTPYKDLDCDRDYIASAATKMMKKHSFASVQNKLSLGKYEEWQKESFAFNTTDVFSSDLKRFEMPSEKYKKNAFRIAEMQLAIAGYRLGETLNAVFGASAATATASCNVIRKIMYPIFKLQTPENIARAKPTIAVLNTCPTGPAARPTILIERMGVKSYRTFDVVKVFESEAAARTYASTNSIKDVSFEIQ